jgi:hypothetical protein
MNKWRVVCTHDKLHAGERHTYDRVLPGAPKAPLQHCCHHLSAMQPSALCLTPLLQWNKALFAVLGRYPLRDEDAKCWILEGRVIS